MELQVAGNVVRELRGSAERGEIVVVPLGFEPEQRLLRIGQGRDVFERFLPARGGKLRFESHPAHLFSAGVLVKDAQAGVEFPVPDPESPDRTLARIDGPLIASARMRKTGTIAARNDLGTVGAIANAFGGFHGVAVAQKVAQITSGTVAVLLNAW